MIHVYHGDGKGKTTAAMGLALRTVSYTHLDVYKRQARGSSPCVRKTPNGASARRSAHVTTVLPLPLEGAATMKCGMDVLTGRRLPHLRRCS